MTYMKQAGLEEKYTLDFCLWLHKHYDELVFIHTHFLNK